MVIIKAKRFVLRPYKKGDKKSLQMHINHRDIYRYTARIPYPYTMKDAKEWIKQCINLNKKKKKDKLNFAIDINNQVVGGIGFDPIEGHKAELGYWLGKKYLGQGIMTEAVSQVTNYGLKRLKLKRITAHVFKGNKASARVLEKNGYKVEGILRKHHVKDGKFIDALLFAKVR